MDTLIVLTYLLTYIVLAANVVLQHMADNKTKATKTVIRAAVWNHAT